MRKGTRLSCVAQVSEFAPGATVRSVIEAALERASALPHEDRAARVAETLGRAGFDDFEVRTDALSGGWKKRLAIAEALVQQPDILLLDEPTNHLDLAGIKWLEALLQQCAVCLRGREPRPLLPGKRRERNRGAEPRLFRRLPARERQLQRISRSEGSSICTRSRSTRRRSKTACARRSNGCGAGPRRAPPNRNRASTKPTK